MKLSELVGSSQIKNYAYNPETEILVIEFHNGGIYKYSEVPQVTMESFFKAESFGSYFNTSIKGKYSFEKLTVQQVQDLP